MQMPQPTDAHKKLETLVGEWVGTETMQPGPHMPEGGTAEGRVTNRLALGGMAVIQNYEQVGNGQVQYSGHGVFQYDSKTEQYTCAWFDCFGMPPNMFTGTFDGDVLKLQDSGASGQHMRCQWDTSGGGLTFEMEGSQDGENWIKMMGGSYSRRD